ncbi:MAG: Sua5/YciO/YrdC/YwlC family protein [Pseudomonadota bacterium]
MASPFQIREAARVLHAGGLVAYPTEAVYGLGCDPLNPNAIDRLLQLKQRRWQKGLILIASSIEQLHPFIKPIAPRYQPKLDASWPGPNTWLVPASDTCPEWIRGTHPTVAVRVTAHPLVISLCNTFGSAIVSTSANHAGKKPARAPLAVLRDLGDEVDYCLHGELGGAERPTAIRDLLSDETKR